MPVRTAAEFAREAPDDGPYELQIGTGRTAKKVRPKPIWDLTRDEQWERARIEGAWARVTGQIDNWPPKTPSGVVEMESSEFLLRCRFGALTKREPTDDDPRRFVATEKHADYDAFQREWVEKMPWGQVAKAMFECDEYYEETPGTPEEKAITSATGILEQAANLLQNGDVDNPRVKEMLAQISEVVEKASATAGKSDSAAGA